MVIHSSLADFILFLYVHLSHADHSYDPKEMAEIKSKMPNLFPAGTNLEKKLYRTIREYNAFDKAKLPDLFKDSFDHFSDESHPQKNKVYHDMIEIVSADGEINDFETKALETLKQLIDLHT